MASSARHPSVSVHDEAMIEGSDRGHSYCDVRGEILGSSQDALQRRRVASTFSSIKSESRRFEDDQIPS